MDIILDFPGEPNVIIEISKCERGWQKRENQTDGIKRRYLPDCDGSEMEEGDRERRNAGGLQKLEEAKKWILF